MDVSTTLASLRKKVAGVSLVAVVASFFATGVATAQTNQSFNDVPPDAWFFPYVQELVENGVIDSNFDNYRPSDLVNRAEMAKLAVEAAGIPMETASAAPFNDVPMGQWYTNYVYTASKNGIVAGYKNESGALTGSYGPGNNLNRAEASKIIVNAFALPEDMSGAPHFPDVKSSDWFYIFVESNFNAGVVAGYPDGSFRPANPINRAEIAKMVSLAMDFGMEEGFVLKSAAAASKTKVELIFSADVDEMSAEDVDNYDIEDSTGNPLNVTAAEYMGGDTVHLTTATQVEGKVYYVTAVNVESDNGEDLANSNEVSFLGYGTDVSGDELTVALSTLTPTSGSVPNGATGVVFTCWDFQSEGTTMLKSLTVKRVGPGTTTAFENVYLYKGDARLTTGRSVNSQSNTVTFSNINQTITDDNTPICLVADLDSATASGGVHAFELTDAASVMSNASELSGSFPLRGAEQLITSAEVSTATISNNGSLSEVSVGDENARIAQFKIANGGSTEDQELRRIALYVTGAVSASDLTNLKLYVEGQSTPLASTATVGDKDLMTFVLNTPYEIARSQSKIFYVTANIVDARNNDELQVYLDESTDLNVVGQTYGYGVQVVNNYSSSTSSEVTVKAARFTIASNALPAGDLATNQKQAVCLDLTLKNGEGSTVDLKDWVLRLNVTGEDLTTLPYTNIRLAMLNDDGSVGGALFDSAELSATGGTLQQNVTVRGTYSIDSGDSVRAGIVLDVAPTATGTLTCTLVAPIANGQVKVGNDSIGGDITPQSNIVGSVQDIVASALTLTRTAQPVQGTKYAKGTANAILYGVQAKAGSAQDTTIKSLTVQASATTPLQATATATVAGNVVTGFTITEDGAGYTTALQGVSVDVNTCATDPTVNYVLNATGGVSALTVVTPGAGCTDGAQTATLAAPQAAAIINIRDAIDSIGLYDSNGALISELKSLTTGSTATVTFNNLNIAVAKNATVNFSVRGTVSNSLVSPVQVIFSVLDSGADKPLVIDQNGETVEGVTATGDQLLNLGTAATVASGSVASNDPIILSENQEGKTFEFRLKSSNGASVLKDMTVNLDTTGTTLPVQAIALKSATSQGACSTDLKAFESVVGSGNSGSVSFTNVNLNLVDSQDTYLCVLLKASMVNSNQPESLSNINIDSITIDKLLDQSGQTISAVDANLTIAGAIAGDADDFFFQGVPTFAAQALPSANLTSNSEVMNFVAGSRGNVQSFNQLAVSLIGQAPADVGACTLFRGSNAITDGTNTESAISGGTLVTFEAADFIGGEAAWTNGQAYRVECAFANLVANDSVEARLAPVAGAAGAAMVWNDGNTPAGLLNPTGFQDVDTVLFFNNVTAAKLTAV